MNEIIAEKQQKLQALQRLLLHLPVGIIVLPFIAASLLGRVHHTAPHHSAKIWENSSELLATGEMK